MGQIKNIKLHIVTDIKIIKQSRYHSDDIKMLGSQLSRACLSLTTRRGMSWSKWTGPNNKMGPVQFVGSFTFMFLGGMAFPFYVMASNPYKRKPEEMTHLLPPAADDEELEE